MSSFFNVKSDQIKDSIFEIKLKELKKINNISY